jgi:hypothetical protein
MEVFFDCQRVCNRLFLGKCGRLATRSRAFVRVLRIRDDDLREVAWPINGHVRQKERWIVSLSQGAYML